MTAAALMLDASGLGPWARESALVYPVANVVHVIGLVMLVGGIGVVDLRVAGLWRALPLGALARALTPVAVAGLLLMLGSGVTLFAADGKALARSDIYGWKLTLLVVALCNAALFRWRWHGRIDGIMPLAARAMALLSLALWLTIAVLGRWIAYG